MALILERAQVDAMIEHARAEHPNECCGLLAGLGDRVLRVYHGRNADQSPYTYRLDPQEQLRFFREIDAAGLDLVGIYHSHTQSAAYPSRTDIAKAYYPDAAYVILSILDPAVPAADVEIRAFRIRDGVVTEEELVIA